MVEQEREKRREIEREKLEHEKLRLEAEEKIEIEKEKIQFVLQMKEVELQQGGQSRVTQLVISHFCAYFRLD